MQEELNLKEWVVDEETGYLKNPIRTNAITPQIKKAFLEAFKKVGNQTKAAESVGISARILSSHLRADRQFSKDYQDALLSMKHVIEGVMFQRAQEPNGFMDRMAWLRKHYPSEYDPKAIKEDKSKTKKAIDDLWDAVNPK